MLPVRPQAAIFLNDSQGCPADRVLALKKPNGIGLLGGKVEPGETPANACAREVFEESGLVIAPSELILVYAAMSTTHFCHVFAPRTPFKSGTPVRPSPEGDPIWCTWAHLIAPDLGALYPLFSERLLVAWINYSYGRGIA